MTPTKSCAECCPVHLKSIQSVDQRVIWLLPCWTPHRQSPHSDNSEQKSNDYIESSSVGSNVSFGGTAKSHYYKYSRCNSGGLHALCLTWFLYRWVRTGLLVRSVVNGLQLVCCTPCIERLYGHSMRPCKLKFIVSRQPLPQFLCGWVRHS